MTPRQLGVYGALLVIASVPSVVRGDQRSGVSLVVDPCIDADRQLVDQLFEVELRTSLSDPGATDSLVGTRVVIGCAGDLVEITVHDPITGKSLTRRIAPGAASGRERLVALAAMELLVASWVELAATPEPVVPGIDSTAGLDARQRARSAVRRRLPALAAAPAWATTVELGVVVHVTGGAHLGGAARLIRDHHGGYGWSLEAAVTTARVSLPLGDVTTDTVGGGASFHLQRRRGPVRGRVGAGAHVALVQMTGDSERSEVLGRHLTGFAGGPLVRTEVEIEPLAGVAVGLAFEAGYYLIAVRGQVDGGAGTSVDGSWLGVYLGGGWAW